VQISQGSSVFFYASSNPSTGYEWQVDFEDCDGIVDISKDHLTNNNDEGMAGVGGVTIFTLVGVSQDKCRFRAVQARSWEFAGFDSDSTRNDWSYIDIPLKVTEFCDSSTMECIQYGITHITFTLSQEGDVCEGFNEMTGGPFPSCAEGLVCRPTNQMTIPGAGNVCVKPAALEGDVCEGFNEMTGGPFPSCAEGLVCRPTNAMTLPGAGNVCVKPAPLDTMTFTEWL